MQTILFLLMTVLILVCLLLVLYFYLAHDDLKRGKLSIFELTNNLECLIPIEIILHLIVSISLLFQQNYILFFINLPVLLYNVKIIVNKDFNYHAFSGEE